MSKEIKVAIKNFSEIKETVKERRADRAEKLLLKEKSKAEERENRNYLKYLKKQEKLNIQGGMDKQQAILNTIDKQRDFYTTGKKDYNIC